MNTAINLKPLRRAFVVASAVAIGAVYLLVMTYAWGANQSVPHVEVFTSIKVVGPINVRIQQGDEQSVAIIGRGPVIDIESVDGTLYIESDDQDDLAKDDLAKIVVEVTVASVDELVVEGAADVSISGFSGDTIFVEARNLGTGIGQIEASEIRFNHLLVSGSGRINFDLHGRATHQDVSILGEGRYLADGLLSQTSVVDVADSGQVSLWTEKLLDLNAADSAQVFYRGTPWINKHVSGNAHLVPRYTAPTHSVWQKNPYRHYRASL